MREADVHHASGLHADDTVAFVLVVRICVVWWAFEFQALLIWALLHANGFLVKDSLCDLERGWLQISIRPGWGEGSEVKLSIVLDGVIDTAEVVCEIIWGNHSFGMSLDKAVEGGTHHGGDECKEEDDAEEISASSVQIDSRLSVHAALEHAEVLILLHVVILTAWLFSRGISTTFVLDSFFFFFNFHSFNC